MLLVLEQCLNGLQLGLLLFLLAAGLTLIFGIMDLVNLAHGSLYMIGAYFAATFVAWTGSFVAGAVLALGATLLVGMLLEVDRDPSALWPRSSRPRARHLRADPVLQRAGADRLGPGGPAGAAAGLAQHLGAAPARPPLSDLPHRHHRHGARGRAAALRAGDAHAARHADPRRRLQPRDGGRARRQHQAALHAGVRPRRRARRARRPDAGADPDRADRHGREHPDPRLRGHHHRRHRLDPRRLRRRHPGRPDRHHRPRLPARPAAPGDEPRAARRPSRPRCRR